MTWHCRKAAAIKWEPGPSEASAHGTRAQPPRRALLSKNPRRDTAIYWPPLIYALEVYQQIG